MKGKKLILNTFLLSIATIGLGFISMGFRVFLSNKIGTEGMGLYQLIMSIHIMTSTFAISGIRITVSRLIAEEIGKGKSYNIPSLMKKGFLYSIFFSTSTALILFNFSEFIAGNLINDPRATVPLQILSCSLPFVGICSCLTGYFYGVRKVVKSIITELLENLIMMGIIVLFLIPALDKDLDYICSLIAVSISISLIISTFVAYILYMFDTNNSKNSYKKGTIKMKDIATIALPIAGSSGVQTTLRTLEDMLIPTALRQYGSSATASLAIFGMIKGMVLPILFFPSIFLASVATLIVPEISEANALNNKKLVNSIISNIIKFTLFIAILSSGIFIIFSKELGISIYNNEDVGLMLKILAPLIPFMYLDRIIDGSLNALNEQMTVLRYNLVDMFLRIGTIFILIPKYGINGFVMVLFISSSVSFFLNINRLLKVTDIEFLVMDWVFKPIAFVSISSFFINILFNTIGFSNLIVLKISLCTITYLILLVIFKCIHFKEILWLITEFLNDLKRLYRFGISKMTRLIP